MPITEQDGNSSIIKTIVTSSFLLSVAALLFYFVCPKYETMGPYFKNRIPSNSVDELFEKSFGKTYKPIFYRSNAITGELQEFDSETNTWIDVRELPDGFLFSPSSQTD